ncbi:WXG100 family type VII secretion target [Galactobacter sp.]|uniref:WXG100 family type VII secretion target n=1 Tax=Galactobacter sp. TaxID=2676125 RepID=UPI0025C29124|nr:WXG100 family type VII secretion target [Galactobacter sp.]
MTQFTADTQAMRTKSAQAMNTVEQLRGEVNALQSSLQDLSGSWTGGASARFQELLTQWRGVQAQVEDSLSRIGQALTSASSRYDEVEQANVALFSG